jgi:hypothetical protein
MAQQIEESIADLRDLENENLNLDTERVLGKMRKNIEALQVSALQKKYRKMDEISNKTAKLSYSEPILREKLEHLREQNRGLLESIQQMGEKYVQYADVLTPLLEVNSVTRNLLDK